MRSKTPRPNKPNPPTAAAPIATTPTITPPPKPTALTKTAVSIIETDVRPNSTQHYQVIELDSELKHKTPIRTYPSARLAEQAAIQHAMQTNGLLILTPEILWSIRIEAQDTTGDELPV